MIKLLARILDRPTWSLCLVFILLDALALLCAWLYTIDVLNSRFFRMSRDRGFIEIFEYCKFALIIYMLLQAFRVTGERVFWAWMILFSVMLADNMIGIHEELGERLITFFTLPEMGFHRPKDLAEIIALALIEGSLCLYVILCYLRASPAGRYFSRQLAALLGMFLVFALILDAVGPYMIEELGEMMGITLIMAWLHTRFDKQS